MILSTYLYKHILSNNMLILMEINIYHFGENQQEFS
jgi:hypothetical protein